MLKCQLTSTVCHHVQDNKAVMLWRNLTRCIKNGRVSQIVPKLRNLVSTVLQQRFGQKNSVSLFLEYFLAQNPTTVQLSTRWPLPEQPDIFLVTKFGLWNILYDKMRETKLLLELFGGNLSSP